jgi:ATP-binding cassette subfamily C protein
MAAVETLDNPPRNHSADHLRVAPGGEPRDYVGPVNALATWRSVARTNLIAVAAFSLVVNLLMLTLPIYLFQISDRVLTSRSLEILLMLSALALAFIGILSIVDILRRQVLGRLATKMEAVLGGAVLASSINSARAGEGGTIQAIRSLHQVRGFISSPIMLLLMDAPLSPLYFGVIFLVHRYLGWIAVVSGLALALIALINQKATSERLSEAGLHAAEADAAAESLARNSQVINAMGMLSESILHWGQRQAPALTVQSQALDRNFWISGASKFVRLVAQITILGTGAYLALHAEITGGMMIAASIIAGRALQPLEGLIEGWRSCVQARSAYARVKQAVESFQRETPKLRLPKPQGRLSVDRVLYLPPGSKEPVLNACRLSWRPENLWPLSDRPDRASRRSRAFWWAVWCRPPARSGWTERSCATGIAASSGNIAATCLRRSSYFPAPSSRTSAACATTCLMRAFMRRRCCRASTIWSASCRKDTRPCSTAAAGRSPEGRSSASRSPGLSSVVRPLSCSTSPIRISTRPASRL